MSRSSRRNKKRLERSKTYKNPNKSDSGEGESKTASRDARTNLESKRQRISKSVQSLVDKRREKRKKTQNKILGLIVVVAEPDIKNKILGA